MSRERGEVRVPNRGLLLETRRRHVHHLKGRTRDVNRVLLGTRAMFIRPSRSVVPPETALHASFYAIVNKFAIWYRALGFTEASSHGGRRTAITRWPRQITSIGGSLRNVKLLAGHSAFGTNQRYIEGSDGAKRQIVKLV